MRVIDDPSLERVLRDMLRRARLRDHVCKPGEFQTSSPCSCSAAGVTADQSMHAVVLTPLQLAQRQLDAYNARDLDRFLANFSEDVRLYRMPALEPVLMGKKEFGEFYASRRFNGPVLHAELISRTVLGNKVFNCERMRGLREHPIERIAVFEVHEGLIRTVWSFSAD